MNTCGECSHLFVESCPVDITPPTTYVNHKEAVKKYYCPVCLVTVEILFDMLHPKGVFSKETICKTCPSYLRCMTLSVK